MLRAYARAYGLAQPHRADLNAAPSSNKASTAAVTLEFGAGVEDLAETFCTI